LFDDLLHASKCARALLCTGGLFAHAKRCLFGCLCGGALFLSAASAQQVAGWVEQVRVDPPGIEAEAKLDTGARHSSIHAEDIQALDVDGIPHVSFVLESEPGERIEVVRPLVRQAKIKQHTSGPETRPVVLLSVCLGGVRKQVEVNLVDRGRLNYPLLIGRSFLAGDFLIDPATKHRLSPRCGNSMD
jgi:hypothetical protein